MNVYRNLKDKKVFITGKIESHNVRDFARILNEIVTSKHPKDRVVLSLEGAEFGEMDPRTWLELWQPLRMVRENRKRGRSDDLKVAARIDFEGWGIVPVFKGTVFHGKVNFSASRFPAYTNFSDAKFYSEVTFNSSHFGELTTFKGAEFKGKTNFDWSHFGFNANFQQIKVFDKITFNRASFEDKVSFRKSVIYPYFYIHIYEMTLLNEERLEKVSEHIDQYTSYEKVLRTVYLMQSPSIIRTKDSQLYLPKPEDNRNRSDSDKQIYPSVTDLKTIVMDFSYTIFGDGMDLSKVEVKIRDEDDEDEDKNKNFLIFLWGCGDNLQNIYRAYSVESMGGMLADMNKCINHNFMIVEGLSDVVLPFKNSYLGKDFIIDVKVDVMYKRGYCGEFASIIFKQYKYDSLVKLADNIGTYEHPPRFSMDFSDTILSKGMISLSRDSRSVYRTELAVLESSIIGNITIGGTVDVLDFSKNNINALVYFEPQRPDEREVER